MIVSRALFVFGLFTLAGAPHPARAAVSPPCLVHAEFIPERAFVGQQILYRVQILRRPEVRLVEWLEPPTFRGLRAEALPGLPAAGEVRRGSVVYRASEEHRAIFAQRTHDLGLGAGTLRCLTRSGDGEQAYTVALAPAAFRALALPEMGRPREFDGLVGPVALVTSLTPRRIALGESVRLAVMLRGSGNLWEARDPLAGRSDLDGAEIFAKRAKLRLETGVRLGVRLHFAYDLVPRREGELRVPELRVAYFDTEEGRYTEAVAPAMTVAVGPRSPAPGPEGEESPGAAAADASPGSEADAERTGTSAPLVVASLAIPAVVAVGVVIAVRRRRTTRAFVALAAADAARARGDADAEAAALANALRTALARHVAEARSANPEELLARALPPDVASGARLLAAVERARYDPTAQLPTRKAVEQALRDLGSVS